MIKKNMIVIFFVIAMGSIVFLYNRSAQDTSTFTKNVSVVEKQIIEKEKNDIVISYPEISGLNKNEDEIINNLITETLYALATQKKNSIYEEYDLFLHLNYDVKFLSDKFISICFIGSEGSLNNAGRGLGQHLYTINIDLAQAKIIDISDIIVKYDQIYNLLAQDKFESITTIEGIKGEYSFSTNYNSPELEAGLDDSYLKYYISEDKLVLIVSGGRQYYEYAININDVMGYLNEDILSKVGK